MENEHTELIIGYLQNNLTQEETDCFYNWVNESASNKELFFEIKAMYDAGLPLSTPCRSPFGCGNQFYVFLVLS